MRRALPLSCAILLLVFFGLWPQTGRAAPKAAFVKSELQRVDEIWPGQRLTLKVTLYTTATFSGAPRFLLPKVSGMLLMRNKDRPLLGSESVDGVSLISKRYEIAIFPLRSGQLTMPAFAVEFAYRDTNGREVMARDQVTSLSFTVEDIPGLPPKETALTTNKLQVEDQWQPAPGKAKRGDAFKRTVTIKAYNLPGIALPPLNLKAPAGIALYPEPPQVENDTVRGAFSGKRLESFSYICQRQGTFIIPDHKIYWWNPQERRLRVTTLKSVTMTVSAGPFPESEELPAAHHDGRIPLKALLITLIGIITTAAALFWARKRRGAKEPNAKEREKRYFNELLKAAESQRAAATMTALLRWLDHRGAFHSPATIRQFTATVADPGLKEQLEALETDLFGTDASPGKPWSGKKTARLLKIARRKLDYRGKHQQNGGSNALPVLNPPEINR